ncbi:MAG: hypothetical protein AABY65_11230, partial [Nitrospirota bacterium]
MLLSGAPEENAAGISTDGLVSSGYTYSITCQSVPGSPVPAVSDSVTIYINNPSVSCRAPEEEAVVGDDVVWTGTVTPPALPAGSGSYSFRWKGTDLPSAGISTPNPSYTARYGSAGRKTMELRLSAPGRFPLSTSCETRVRPAPPNLSARID